MAEARAQVDAVQGALAAARKEVARLENMRADQERLLVEELKRDLRDCFIEPVREGISLSTFTRISVEADERRLGFEISTEDFLEFADGVAKLAEAEKAANEARERVLAGGA